MNLHILVVSLSIVHTEYESIVILNISQLSGKRSGAGESRGGGLCGQHAY
jgi:hypothetical protein